MKIKTKIDEVICTGVVIGDGAYAPIKADFGFVAQGFRCGHVEITGISDDKVRAAADALLYALEEHFVNLVGEPTESEEDRPSEIKGLIPQEF